MAVAAYIAIVILFLVIARLRVAYRAVVNQQRHTDPLTGLPNRPGFEAILEKHLKVGAPFSVVWLDLDGFRNVNGQHCRSGGDTLLAQIGPRIRRCLRPGDATARFGGDQFMILLRGHDATAAITSYSQFDEGHQPIVDAEGTIVRMEALVRIDDPVLGRVAPLEFIGVAEESGLILEVGAWILRRACRQARDWRDSGIKTAVTVNLSPHQLETNDLADRIVNEIAQWRLGKGAVTIHITGGPKSVVAVERLRSAGIAVSCHQLLFDEIRVSEPFDLPADCPEITVIGRGIETPQQLDLAHAAGCDYFQGFQIAPPLESPDATEILRAGLFAFAGSGFIRSQDPLG